MQVHTVQDATGQVSRIPPDGILDIVKRVAPTDTDPGYAVGCFWRNLAGAPGGILWVNIGSTTSANWMNIT
jgi:hypothetical protein